MHTWSEHNCSRRITRTFFNTYLSKKWFVIPCLLFALLKLQNYKNYNLVLIFINHYSRIEHLSTYMCTRNYYRAPCFVDVMLLRISYYTCLCSSRTKNCKNCALMGYIEHLSTYIYAKNNYFKTPFYLALLKYFKYHK